MSSTTNTLSSGISFSGELPDSTAASSNDASLGNVFDGVLGAFRQDGYEAGYHRAVNDLLAEFVFISEEFIRSHTSRQTELRQVFRAFEERLERAAGAPSANHFVDGGLGI